MKIMRWPVSASGVSVIGSGPVQAVFPSRQNSYSVDVYTREDGFSRMAVRDAFIVMTGEEFSMGYKILGSVMMEQGIAYHVLAGASREVKTDGV